jgi:hypothetical protein
MIPKARAWIAFQFSGTMFISPRRLMRACTAAFPKWLLRVWLVLRFIPTPFEIDEWVPAIILLVILVVQPHRIGKFRSAWHGGKSHRAYDLAVA